MLKDVGGAVVQRDLCSLVSAGRAVFAIQPYSHSIVIQIIHTNRDLINQIDSN